MKDDNRFAALLSCYVERSRASKNELIRLCGINRSSFFQFLAGKRAPSPEQLDHIIAFLQLPSKDEQELRTQFQRMEVGEQTWQNRRSIFNCLRTLAGADHFNEYEPLAAQTLLAPSASCLACTGSDSVFRQLQHFLQAAFSAPQPRLDFFMPSQNSSFFEELKALYREKRDSAPHIRQLIQFPTGKDLLNCSILEDFNNILFFLTSGRSGYQAYYYYDTACLSNSLGVPYPYYVFSPEGLVLIDAGFSHSIAVQNPTLLATTKDSFERALAQSRNIVCRFADTGAAFGLLEKAPGATTCAASLCVSSLATDYLIDTYAPAPLQPMFYEHCHAMQSIHPSVEFCSLSCLARFAETGKLDDLTGRIIAPVKPEDRAHILESLLPRLNESLYFIDEASVPLSREWTIALYGSERLLIFRNGLHNLELIDVAEKNIVDAFVDYFASLPGTPAVLPRERAAEVIRQLTGPAKQRFQGPPLL